MITTKTLEFDIRSETPIKFRGFSGVALRGALFQALDILYTGNDPSFVKSYQTDPLLHLMMRQNSIDKITRNTVSPFVIRSPIYMQPHELTFGISLFGRGRNLLPYITSAVEAMGTIGIGVHRTKFEIMAIRQAEDLYPLEDQISAIDTWERLVEFSENNPIHSLGINFLTPTMIIQHKKLHIKPCFKVWFHRLLERVLHLRSLIDTDEKWIPVNDLLAKAEIIETSQDNTTLYGSMRSNRNSRNIFGFQGYVHYIGNFAGILPYLMLGERIHVGKNTVKGCGRYVIKLIE